MGRARRHVAWSFDFSFRNAVVLTFGFYVLDKRLRTDLKYLEGIFPFEILFCALLGRLEGLPVSAGGRMTIPSVYANVPINKYKIKDINIHIEIDTYKKQLLLDASM